MQFINIPNDRRIKVSVDELLRLGYQMPCSVTFELAEGNNPCFKLQEVGKERGEISFGPVKLAENGMLKVPKELKLFNQYMVRYFDKSLQIMLTT